MAAERYEKRNLNDKKTAGPSLRRRGRMTFLLEHQMPQITVDGNGASSPFLSDIPSQLLLPFVKGLSADSKHLGCGFFPV